jgi:Arc/MetJ-type ribon-helix-helix transcriptional regulator
MLLSGYIYILYYTYTDIMARITVKLDDDLDRAVRTEISKRGGKKGDLAITVQEALRLWLEKKEKKGFKTEYE